MLTLWPITSPFLVEEESEPPRIRTAAKELIDRSRARAGVIRSQGLRDAIAADGLVHLSAPATAHPVEVFPAYGLTGLPPDLELSMTFTLGRRRQRPA